MNELSVNHGRPADLSGRADRETRVYDLLDTLNISYLHVDHDIAMTMEACHDADEALGVSMCKNLFLCNRQKTSFYLLLMPGDKPFKTKDLSAQINSPRLSFAPEEKMLEFLDIHPGSVSVMGLMNDVENKVQLLIDKDLCSAEFIGCHPCVNTSSLRIKTTDILEVFLPAIKHSPVFVTL